MVNEQNIAQHESDVMTDEMENMYLNFFVGQEVYGVEIRYVLQIIGMQDIKAMPEMPPFMKGFINLRGSVIPVVSMRERFGKTVEPYTDRHCIVIVRVGDREIGLIVDAIKETLTIEPDKISPQPATSPNNDNKYIMGIAKLGGGNISILISVQKLFESYNY